MERNDQRELIKICISYRIISVLLSTGMYLFLSYREQRPPLTTLGVAAGMIAACAVGTHLYQKIISQEAGHGWMAVTLCLELAAYGIFVLMSGGFASPYLWYGISCIFITMAAARRKSMTLLAAAWCLLCAAFSHLLGYPEEMHAYLNLNTSIAVVIVAGGFYTLFVYIRRLNRSRDELQTAMRALRAEKELSEQALRQVMELYDAANLFAITDTHSIMEELSRLLGRTVARDGCVLVKLNLDREIEQVGSCGLAEETVSALVRKLAELPGPAAVEFLTLEGDRYRVRAVGGGIVPSGVLLMPERPGEEECGPVGTGFYCKLAEVILRGIETQKWVEEYIVSEEQNRIAEEIHDTVIQKLFSTACTLRVVEADLDGMTREGIRERLRATETSVRQTMKELREAIYGLRFEGEEQLEGKLRLYAEELGSISGTEIRLDAGEDLSAMTASQKTAAYRIICEALNNAVRHGRAERVEARIGMDREGITISVCDDGCGFDAASAPGRRGGLKNMHQLALYLRGKLTVDSGINEGTNITVCFPR